MNERIMIGLFVGKNEGCMRVCAWGAAHMVSRGVAADSAQPRPPPRRRTAFPGYTDTRFTPPSPTLRTLTRVPRPVYPPLCRGDDSRGYRILFTFLRKLESSLDINTQKFHFACHYHVISMLVLSHLIDSIKQMFGLFNHNINNNHISKQNNG